MAAAKPTSARISAPFLKWFFGFAPRRIIDIAKGFLRWDLHFFSVGYLATRLLSPWHRDITGYGRGFDLGRFLRVWGWNTVSRVIGLVLRLAVMITGIVVFVLILFAGAGVFILWFLLPLMVPILIVAGAVTTLIH